MTTAFQQSQLEKQAIRQQFEEDAAALGFDTTRSAGSLSGEPWDEYDDETTGHRWAGWLAIAEREPVGMTPEQVRDVIANWIETNIRHQEFWTPAVVELIRSIEINGGKPGTHTAPVSNDINEAAATPMQITGSAA